MAAPSVNCFLAPVTERRPQTWTFCGMTRPGIEPSSPVSVACAQPIRPLSRIKQWTQLGLNINRVRLSSVWVLLSQHHSRLVLCKFPTKIIMKSLTWVLFKVFRKRFSHILRFVICWCLHMFPPPPTQQHRAIVSCVKLRHSVSNLLPKCIGG